MSDKDKGEQSARSSHMSTVEVSAMIAAMTLQDDPADRINEAVTGEVMTEIKHAETCQPTRGPPRLWRGQMKYQDVQSISLGPILLEPVEKNIILDLLAVFEGYGGDKIVAEPVNEPFEPRNYVVSKNIDVALEHQIKSLLPMASNYSIVTYFIDQGKELVKGTVVNALSEAMGLIAKEYRRQIGEWEELLNEQKLSLSSLWSYSQTALVLMKIVANVAIIIGKSQAMGGEVLTILHNLTMTYLGDHNGYKTCLYLTQMSSVPYMDMLEKWIHHGIMNDPYDEFLVEDHTETLEFDEAFDYWNKQFTVRKDMLPIFLEEMSQDVLRTGKYLDTVRQCSNVLTSPLTDKLVYTATESMYVRAIEKAYVFAGQTLVDILLKNCDLVGRLRSMKRYFALDQGDFIVHFTDICESELAKNIADIDKTRVNALFELALRTGYNDDQYMDDLQNQILTYNLYDHRRKIHSILTTEEEDEDEPRGDNVDQELTGIKCFSFTYEVEWPVSIVINNQVILRYQLIFRHLFYCNHVERLLCHEWLCEMVTKKYNLVESFTVNCAFLLRQRMLNFIQNIEAFMMGDVIEPYWQEFLAMLVEAKNVDDVLEYHDEFLDNCLKDCFLASRELLVNVRELMNVCVQFCRFMEGINITSDADFGDGQTFNDAIAAFDEEFSELLFQLRTRLKGLARKSDGLKLVTIISRLDGN